MTKSLTTLLLAAGASSAAFAQQSDPAFKTSPAPQVAVTAPVPTVQPRMVPSPRGSAATQVGGKWVEEKPGAAARYRDGKWITVDYGRPILRGRMDIFGSGADYGKKVNAGSPVWRVGANATTRFATEVPLVMEGKALPKGEYSLFIELKEGAWTLVLSTQPALQKFDPKDKSGTWGSENYDPKFDVMRVPMKLSKGAVSVDQLTLGFTSMTQAGGTFSVWWDKEQATVDFKVGQ